MVSFMASLHSKVRDPVFDQREEYKSLAVVFFASYAIWARQANAD